MVFIDTNVIVYARFADAPWHDSARESLRRIAESPEARRISRQVLREYLATCTRPQAWGGSLAMPEALADVARLRDTFDVLDEDPRVTEWLLTLCREVPVAGRQVHDANIVATMLAHGERRLLTFDAADFRRYGPRVELVAPA